MLVNRRQWLIGTSAVALAGPALAGLPRLKAGKVGSAPLSAVSLQPSIYADALHANRVYLASLEPERFLHNFYLSAGLPAPKPVYGGWEALGIAGHSLGHWLSAVSFTIANTGDSGLASKLDFALAEMARIQAAHGDGYCGGTTVERDGKTVDGKIVFEEIRAGKIWSGGFDLNGGWVPLYTWHKIHAGLIDAHRFAGNPRAMPILLGVAGYMAGVLEPLDDQQMQKVLQAEHGGLNESYAETYALTGNPRWLRMAEKIYHRAVLDPLEAEEDRLDGLHANTQIPKIIGLARIRELTGEPKKGVAAEFFHHAVVDHHSYVIGGNSDREHFGPPDKLAHRITETTCEGCNSYNMLKLTRHLFSWQPDARLFDFYERTHLNHIMAQQRPDTGQFVYFMPLAAGARRSYSTAEDSFWCCVGTGMESHSKHADSIFWHDGEALLVNLYIPARLDWAEQGFALALDTGMPFAGDVAISVERAPRGSSTIALRLPGWAAAPRIAINGKPASWINERGYAKITRHWRRGDKITMNLPMALASHATPDDSSLQAYTYGPIVLAADMGAADTTFDDIGPALFEAHPPHRAEDTAREATFTATTTLGENLNLHPYFAQYDRRTAVYFPHYSAAGWSEAKASYLQAQAAHRDIARRTADVIYLGEMQPERDHAFKTSDAPTIQLHGRSARKLKAGQSIDVTLARRAGPALLQIVYWGWDADSSLDISIDGELVAREDRKNRHQDHFVTIDYPLPDDVGGTKKTANIRLDGLIGDTDVYEIRMMEAPTEAASVS
ncbi:glycoside hydrolase family 127 protein [Tsuneonella mangrovi]|uniref:glycoside hydrolase family 127 protein n=1 Tax=Tsuneonella mangrovi TaxID=1982042 RepID=UPI000BA1FE14|nr:glycoside hydrolase family 127 protein [Tsuneonella mangrovi]